MTSDFSSPDAVDPAETADITPALNENGWTHSAFFKSHAPRLEALIRSRLSRRFQARFDAEDIIQSAFRSFFLRQPQQSTADLAESDRAGDLWPLLAQIAVHKLSQQIRRHSAQRRNVAADALHEDQVASPIAGPDESASVTEVISLVQSSLDQSAREAFTMRLEGFEILEIAERLRISERTVRRLLSTSKQILNRLLESEPPFAVPEPSTWNPAHQTQIQKNELPIDLSFDDYRLHQWIGDGAVGNVYRATEKSTGNQVAVKFLKKAFRFHPQAVASFRTEVQVVSQLNHPGIIRIIGMGQATKQFQSAGRSTGQGDFLVMDWAPGGDLARYTAGNRPSLHDIQGWVLELAKALHHAHQQGIVHCDLKPSNILIGASGQLLVSDFGLARQLIGWTGSGQSAGGTPAYIAPELVDPGWGPVGPWTDVFGLGASLFNLLTDRAPFEGATLKQVLSNIISTNPIAWPLSCDLSIPEVWRSVCGRMLAKSAKARYPDMIAVMNAVQGVSSLFN